MPLTDAQEGYSFLVYEDYAANLQQALQTLDTVIANPQAMAYFKSITVQFACAVEVSLRTTHITDWVTVRAPKAVAGAGVPYEPLH